jgi:hypothetical protein
MLGLILCCHHLEIIILSLSLFGNEAFWRLEHSKKRDAQYMCLLPDASFTCGAHGAPGAQNFGGSTSMRVQPDSNLIKGKCDMSMTEEKGVLPAPRSQDFCLNQNVL